MKGSVSFYMCAGYIPACSATLHFHVRSIIEFPGREADWTSVLSRRGSFVSLHRISSFVRGSECQLQKLPEITIDRVPLRIKCVRVRRNAPFRSSWYDCFNFNHVLIAFRYLANAGRFIFLAQTYQKINR